MSLSVPNTGATAVEASRYAVITQDRLETSWNWRPMVGSAVATMVWSSAARNMVSIRLIRMVRTSLGVSGARGAIGGASARSMTSVEMRASSRAAVFRQRLSVSRVTALAVELVHVRRIRCSLRGTPRGDSFCESAIYAAQVLRTAAPARAHGCIPRAVIARNSVICRRMLDQALAASAAPASAAMPATARCGLRSCSAGISSSVPCTRPRTETPASCTVLGSPEISGCRQ